MVMQQLLQKLKRAVIVLPTMDVSYRDKAPAGFTSIYRLAEGSITLTGC